VLLALFLIGGIFGEDTDTTTTDQPTTAATWERSEPEPTEQIAPPVEATTTTAAPPPAPTTTPPPPPPAEPPPPAPVPLAPAPPPAEPGDECHPSYVPCVTIASDVDCEGGTGNGPAYTGRVQVIGPDEYDLDRDGNGIGCEQS
jgi:hypothetical protein